MGFINTLIRTATWPAFRQFERCARDPERAQQNVWNEVRHILNRSSYWGARARGLRLEEFPISDFETYRATLNHMQSERVSSLSGEEIIFWAESGGTSGAAKLFPLTRGFQRQFQRTMAPYLHANTSRFSGFADLPVAYLAGLLPQKKAPSGVDIGYISGFNYQNIPWPLKSLYVLPQSIFADAKTFQEWAPVYAAASDISGLFSITPAMVEQFFELIWRERLRILKTLKMNRGLRVTKSRLNHLEVVFSMNAPSLQDLWPGLSFIGCWKTSSCALQIENLQRWVRGRTPIIDAIYSATEGWTTVPIQGDTGGVFHAGSHVVEFHEIGEHPQRTSLLKPWQLEVGKEYEIFLTTAMGFVRYRLYDVLQCTGYWRRSPILEFRRKAGQQISLGTVRITENELVACLQKAQFVPKGSYCYAPNSTGNGLVFLASDERDLDPHLHTKVDVALQEVSPFYRNDINDGLVVPMTAVRLPPDHPFWCRQGHAQEKPRTLVHDFIAQAP